MAVPVCMYVRTYAQYVCMYVRPPMDYLFENCKINCTSSIMMKLKRGAKNSSGLNLHVRICYESQLVQFVDKASKVATRVQYVRTHAHTDTVHTCILLLHTFIHAVRCEATVERSLRARTVLRCEKDDTDISGMECVTR